MSDKKWTDLWVKESWNNFKKNEIAVFKGTIVQSSKSSNDSTLQRDTGGYQLKLKDGKVIEIYGGNTDELKVWLNKSVELEAKEEKFELEGKNLHELHPTRIKLQ